MLSDDILTQYKDIEKERIRIAEEVSNYESIGKLDLMNKAVDKYNYLTDKLDRLDKKYQEIKRIE
jgi:hypothetical protein